MNIKDQCYNFKWFFRNIWYYRKILWQHRNWDYAYSLLMFSKSLEDLGTTLMHDGLHPFHREAKHYGRQVLMVSGLLKEAINEYEHPIYDKLSNLYFENILANNTDWVRFNKYEELKRIIRHENLTAAFKIFSKRYKRWWC